MKDNQQLLKEAKILETKLAQIKKQISLNEVKRMQQLAGINEIKIDNPLGRENFDPNNKQLRFSDEEWNILLDLYYMGDGNWDTHNVGDMVKYKLEEDEVEDIQAYNSLKRKLRIPLKSNVELFNSEGRFFVDSDGNISYEYMWTDELDNIEL